MWSRAATTSWPPIEAPRGSNSLDARLRASSQARRQAAVNASAAAPASGTPGRPDHDVRALPSGHRVHLVGDRSSSANSLRRRGIERACPGNDPVRRRMDSW